MILTNIPNSIIFQFFLTLVLVFYYEPDDKVEA